MIRQVGDIYPRLLKGVLILALGAGLSVGRIENMKKVAKKALVRGLVPIPLSIK